MKMNQQQYAAHLGISQPAVCKKIKRYMDGKSKLPTGVTKIEKIGRVFIIHVK